MGLHPWEAKHHLVVNVTRVEMHFWYNALTCRVMGWKSWISDPTSNGSVIQGMDFFMDVAVAVMVARVSSQGHHQ